MPLWSAKSRYVQIMTSIYFCTGRALRSLGSEYPCREAMYALHLATATSSLAGRALQRPLQLLMISIDFPCHRLSLGNIMKQLNSEKPPRWNATLDSSQISSLWCQDPLDNYNAVPDRETKCVSQYACGQHNGSTILLPKWWIWLTLGKAPIRHVCAISTFADSGLSMYQLQSATNCLDCALHWWQTQHLRRAKRRAQLVSDQKGGVYLLTNPFLDRCFDRFGHTCI